MVRLLVLLVALGLAAVAAALSAARVTAEPTAGPPKECPGARLRPVPDNGGEVKMATLCLLNAERARHGLRPLRRDARLDAAALGHSRDMAARRFFAHRTPDGVEPQARIARAGYRAGVVGENLAWGEESRSTPAEMVALWLRSPGHRANILEPRYSDLGIGMAYEAPEPQPVARRAAVYTTTFGSGAEP